MPAQLDTGRQKGGEQSRAQRSLRPLSCLEPANTSLVLPGQARRFTPSNTTPTPTTPLELASLSSKQHTSQLCFLLPSLVMCRRLFSCFCAANAASSSNNLPQCARSVFFPAFSPRPQALTGIVVLAPLPCSAPQRGQGLPIPKCIAAPSVKFIYKESQPGWLCSSLACTYTGHLN